ncbi:carcinine hydrolase/isopenicillin-N N-acyltransferase family protein [Blastopirellula marina]|uniref:Peptidase C45 n=1 Tax=Blastopirellula marina TaxID=124 RepID=A0A2S8GIA0_9BACT|nr:carcinine hydrolase/isopenicillin-N N-acyltransferase family protein [Blastopirellula marina]PQO44182.1 peptidase C45 [Blastopirellula marina]
MHRRTSATPFAILLGTLTMLATALSGVDGRACTTAVISGKATVDGRPILWKNRDTTSSIHNEVAMFDDGKYKAIGVINAGNRGSIWMGVNEAGLCIENSVSRDLKLEGKQSGPGNGGFIKKALQTCATVADVVKLLEETNKTGRVTVANFGVIDAQGGAALFETGPKSYRMFDANDPAVAPHGYVVRSNFSTTAHNLDANPSPEDLGEIYSADRYLRACSLMKLDGDAKLSVEHLVRRCTRDMAQADMPFPGTVNAAGGTLPKTIGTKNTISRTTTVSAAVFHGVLPGEDPALTTMWTILGDPKFSIAVPCWVAGGVADELEDEKGGELGEIAISMRDWNMTPDKDGVYTHALPGIWNDLWAAEDKLLADTQKVKQSWAKRKVVPAVVARYHAEAAKRAMQAMEKEFLESKAAALAVPQPAIPQFDLQSTSTNP